MVDNLSRSKQSLITFTVDNELIKRTRDHDRNIGSKFEAISLK